MGTRRGDWSQVDTPGGGQVASWIVLAARQPGHKLRAVGLLPLGLGLLVQANVPSATPWLNKFGMGGEEAAGAGGY